MNKKKMLLAASVAGLLAVSSVAVFSGNAFAEEAATSGTNACAGKNGCKGKHHHKKHKKHHKKAKAAAAAAVESPAPAAS